MFDLSDMILMQEMLIKLSVLTPDAREAELAANLASRLDDLIQPAFHELVK